MAEKFEIKWSGFQLNASNTYKKLRKEEEFFDVTLVGSDRKKFPAHRLVLASGSTFFKAMLKGNSDSKLMLCLENVNSNDIENVLDFVYEGQVNILQTDLERFLSVAKRFELEGLNESVDNSHLETLLKPKTKRKAKEEKKEQELMTLHMEVETEETKVEPNEEEKEEDFEIASVVSFKKRAYIPSISNYRDRIKADMKKKNGFNCCNTCGYSSKEEHNVISHMESHVVDLTFKCQGCNKDFSSRASIRSHQNKKKCF